MERALKWGSNLITVILGILLILTVYMTITSRIYGVPKVFGLQMYEVLSGSMEPGIHTGSVIFVKAGVDTKSLKEGDIITFKSNESPNMLITHRIVEVKTQDGTPAFQTKGDANDSVDPSLVPAGNVVAQYSNITIPYMGYYLNFMKSKMGIMLLVIVPGVLLILVTVIGLIREILKLENTNSKTDSLRATSETRTESSNGQ